MEIRDPVHGSINILDQEIPIIQHDFFQRLRNIKQLGFSEYVFPGATHTRLLHSLGVMDIGRKAFNKIFKDRLTDPNVLRLKETFKLACLLHDIGHAPLSHSTESVMPSISELQIPKRFLNPKDLVTNRQANHEDYTIKSIIDSSFTASFNEVEKKFKLEKEFIADLIRGSTPDENYFTIDGINYFPLLHQLISGEMDCDRMDYLLRDSYFCGVSYGNYDLDWLIDNLGTCIIDQNAYLGISERAVVTFDDFLLSRFHMFLQVYFHYRSVCLEQLLLKYFQSSQNEYVIPADIEKYQEHDDHYLMKILRKSTNKYAIAITKNQIPDKIYESFNEKQKNVLEKLEKYLKDNNLEFIRSSSSGRLSKYYCTEVVTKEFPLKVVRTIANTAHKSYTDINEATDLFQKFSKAHAVNRIHCDLNSVSDSQKSSIINIIQTIT